MRVTVNVEPFDEIAKFKSLAARERVTMANPSEAVWFVARNDQGDVLGFVCAVIKKLTARYKSDYVFPANRGKNIYQALFSARDEYCRARRIKRTTAFCTPMSLGTYLRRGFKGDKKNKNGIVFVKREEI